MQLLNLFTVAGDAGDSFVTDWVPFPADYDQLEFRVSCKMFNGTQINVALLSGMDTDEGSASTLTTTNVTATGTTVTTVTANICALVRLQITIVTNPAQGVFSVWALPKRS
jgi:hypothetical protein